MPAAELRGSGLTPLLDAAPGRGEMSGLTPQCADSAPTPGASVPLRSDFTEARLPLRPQGRHDHHVFKRVVGIQGQTATGAASDHQVPAPPFTFRPINGWRVSTCKASMTSASRASTSLASCSSRCAAMRSRSSASLVASTSRVTVSSRGAVAAGVRSLPSPPSGRGVSSLLSHLRLSAEQQKAVNLNGLQHRYRGERRHLTPGWTPGPRWAARWL